MPPSLSGAWLAALIACLVGCAPSVGRPRPLRPARSTDDAVELAAQLPERADRCVVVRPRRVPARRRGLVLYRSWARPEAWSNEWHVVAYAEALTESPRARRSYLRFARRTDALMRRLRQLPVHWLDEPCEGAACRRPIARWVDERTLEISLHRWPRDHGDVPGAACVRLARSNPRAVEVGADGTGDHGRFASSLGLAPRWGVDPQPHRVHRLLLTDGERLTARRILTFRDEPSALAWESLRRTTPEIRPSLMPVDPSHTTIARVNNRITVVERHLWEELELRLEDERLISRAHAHRRERAEPLALEEVDVQNLAVVRHQVRLRQAEVQRARGEARVVAARRLAALLARATEVHPARLELAERLVRLELDVLERPERAEAAVERVLGSGVAADADRWRQLLREALAMQDPARLGRALVEDGLARGPRARRAAEDLSSLVAAGVDYEWAEGAWRESGRMFGDRGPSRPSAGAIDFVGAVGAVVTWARASGAAGEGPAVHVAARWSGQAEVRALGRARPELLVFRAGSGRSMAVGAVPRADLASLRSLGASLASVVAPGPIEIVIELTTPEGVHLRQALSGRRVGQTLEVSRADDALAALRWDAAQRYLAEPIAQLPTALFPPPELTIRAASPEEATELRRSADAAAPGACRIAGPYLRCRSPGRPARLTDVLVAIARDRPMTP